MMARFVQQGQLTIIDADGHQHVHGPGGEPSATIRLTDKALYRSLFLNPELKAGEAYMDGTLICEEGGIRALLDVFAHNREGLRGQPMQKALKKWLKKIRKWHQRNKTSASRKNVQHHYDLSNEFYKLFLDDDMQYSCAYWPSLDITLEEAQRLKKAHIAAKLHLKPGMKVLDIGCGWGGMAIYLAQNYDVEVVGVTLSDEQLALGHERVKKLGLEGKVDLRLQDYRHVPETFDRIVSVGMFEHVGVAHYLESQMAQRLCIPLDVKVGRVRQGLGFVNIFSQADIRRLSLRPLPKLKRPGSGSQIAKFYVCITPKPSKFGKSVSKPTARKSRKCLTNVSAVCGNFIL